MKTRIFRLASAGLLVGCVVCVSSVGCGGGGASKSGVTYGTGSGNSNPQPAPPPVTLIADNWQLGEPSAVRQIGAALNLTDSTIKGAAHILFDGSSCFAPGQGVSLSGTIDPQGNVSVTSSPLNGQVLTLTGVLDSGRTSILLGNYNFTGGCANGEGGPITGVKFKPVTGTYSGMLTNVALSADLTQSPDLVGTDFLHVNGTVIYSTPTCSEVFTITDSRLAGRYIQLNLAAKDGKSTSVYGSVDSEASQLNLADVDDGGCGGGGYGILKRQ